MLCSPQLSAAEAQQVYYGNFTTTRLQNIKSQVDPTNLFSFPQAIETLLIPEGSTQSATGRGSTGNRFRPPSFVHVGNGPSLLVKIGCLVRMCKTRPFNMMLTHKLRNTIEVRNGVFTDLSAASHPSYALVILCNIHVNIVTQVL